MVSAIDILTNVIIRQYFTTARCLLIFTDNSNDLYYSQDVPFIKIQTNTGNIRADLIFQNYGCQDILIKTNKPVWLFKALENEIRLNMERFNNRKYLFITGNNVEEDLMDIFKLNEISYVSNLVIIEEIQESVNGRSTFNLWTHQYIGQTNSNAKLLLDIWFANNETFKNGHNLYPNKLLNQMGRELKMATFEYEPYSIIGPSIDHYQGSEMSTAVAFANMYNMTPVLVINPEDYWGEIFDNWTGNGLLGNLVVDKADIGFGALYTWEVVYHFLELSKPLVRTGITCLVPAPNLAAGWLTPLYSYSPAMWIAVGGVYVAAVFSICAIHYFYSNMDIVQDKQIHKSDCDNKAAKLLTTSAFSVFKLLLLQAIAKKEIPPRASGSYLMGLLFVFSLFLASTYNSGYSTIMTIPRYENPINTVVEFWRSGLSWGATQDAWITSIQKAEDPVYQDIVRQFHPTPENELRELSKTGKFAFSVERLPQNNYAIGSYINEDVIDNFHLMQEDLYWEQCVIMTRKSSILLPLLDMFILRVFEAGLISYWQNKAVMLSMDAKVQKAVKYYHRLKSDQKAVKLKWVYVEGAFGALCMGCIISMVVFVLELLVDIMCKRKQQQILEYLN